MALFGRLVTVFLLVFLYTGAVTAQTEQRVALVIGNSDYENFPPGLKNPVNDATKMAELLRRAGFEVIVAKNAKKRDIIKAVRIFAEKLSPGGVGLFFYAGHGIQVQGVNYLVPADAMFSVEGDVKYEGFNLQDVLDILSDSRVRLSIAILDACRDNPWAKSFRSISRGLATIDPPRGTLIAYSTKAGNVAADGDGENGVYTSELLKVMSVPGLKLLDVFIHVTDAVEQVTKNAQSPVFYGNPRGDFYFFPPPRVNDITTTSQPGGLISDREQAAWSVVAGSTTPGPFEAFIKQFPSGVFADIAYAKLAEMKTPHSPIVVGPSGPPEGLDQARSWCAGSDPDLMIRGCTTVIQSKPEDFEAFSQRGTAYATNGQPDRALQDYDEAIRINARYALAFFNRGNLYRDLGQPDPAIQDYDEAIRLDPSFAFAFNNRGVVYASKQQTDRAIDDYNQAIRLSPDFALAFNNRGFAYSSKGQFTRAIQDYDQAIRLGPGDARSFVNRGTAYKNMGLPDRAIPDYDEAIRLNPNFAAAYVKRGNVYDSKRQWDRAMQDYNDAIRLDPSFPEAFNDRANCYYSKRLYDRAIQDYDEAVRLDPKDAVVFTNRGEAYLARRQYERAIQDFDQAIRLKPDSAVAFDKRGLALHALGRPQATQDFTNAKRSDPELPKSQGAPYAQLP